MENEICVFRHKVFGEIRTMTNERGETFFAGKDVAMALGYSDPQKAIKMHVDNEDKLTRQIVVSGQKRKIIFINESGLYSLILSSKLEQARAFKRWVTAEVLPQIRMTGGYIPTKDAEGRQLSNEEILQRAEVIVGRTLRFLNGPSEDCMTATAVAHSWGMDVVSFNNLLCGMGIVYRRGGRLHLTEELQGLGLTEYRHFMYYSLKGGQRPRTYLVWTAAGVEYICQRLMARETASPKVVQLNMFINNLTPDRSPEEREVS